MRFTLNKQDLIKIGKGFLIAVGGAALVYFTEVFAQIDWGTWTPVVTALSAVLINAARKWLQNVQE